MSTTDRAVILKIAKCIAQLGGTSDLIGTVSSWKDSLDNEEVLESLNDWLSNEVHVHQPHDEDLHTA